jgi:glycosyltransferase involved in cell wall biosynthesis
MKIVYLTAGSGRWECDACLRDGDLAKALMALGHEVLFIPTYTPLVIEEASSVTSSRIFYGGVNVYLRHRFRFLRNAPSFLLKVFDQPWLLRLAARMEDMTDARSLADLTISVLQGEHGAQRKELDKLLDWLETQLQPDFFILPNSMFAGLAEPVRRRFKCPVYCLLSGEDGFIEQFPEPERSKTKDILRQQAARMDRFIVTNRYYQDFMSAYLGVAKEKIHVIPMGVNPLYYDREKTPPDVFTIAYRSPICPGNGFDLLIEAWRLLRKDKRLAPCRLVASGHLGASDRAYFNKWLGRIRDWGLEADFEYVGELKPSERSAFLRRASVLSTPVRYPEPVGMFVPESMLAGVPVVLTKRGCMEEWIEETGGGLLVKPDDPAALADGIRRLMEDSSLLRALAEKGRKAILEKFTVEKMARGVVRALGSCKDQNRGGCSGPAEIARKSP